MERPFVEMGLRIREARVEAGMGQKDLAEALGVTVQSVSQWETGRSQPETDRLIEMGGYLGVSWNWLKTGSGSKESAARDPRHRNEELLSRFAPIWAKTTPMSVLLRAENAIDRFDDDTVIARYPSVGLLFSIINDTTYEQHDLIKGDILIFDTGITLTVGDYALVRHSKSSMGLAHVRSIILEDDGRKTARLRLLDSAKDIEVSATTGLEVFAVMIERRRYRPR